MFGGRYPSARRAGFADGGFVVKPVKPGHRVCFGVNVVPGLLFSFQQHVGEFCRPIECR